MNHPLTLQYMVKDRIERLHREADHERLVRQLTSVARIEPRERFRIRDLRWILFRPAGA